MTDLSRFIPMLALSALLNLLTVRTPVWALSRCEMVLDEPSNRGELSEQLRKFPDPLTKDFNFDSYVQSTEFVQLGKEDFRSVIKSIGMSEVLDRRMFEDTHWTLLEMFEQYVKLYSGGNRKRSESIKTAILAELYVSKKINENFFKVANLNNRELSLRTSDTMGSGFEYSRLPNKLRSLTRLSPSEFELVKPHISELFFEQVDENIPVALEHRLRILAWLKSPLSKIRTPEQLLRWIQRNRAFPPVMASPQFGDRTCTIHNSEAYSILLAHGFFVVLREQQGRNLGQTNHMWVEYYPLGGAEPIVIDRTFRQFENDWNGNSALKEDWDGLLVVWKSQAGSVMNFFFSDTPYLGTAGINLKWVHDFAKKYEKSVKKNGELSK